MEGTKAIQKFLPSRGHETFVFVHGAWHGTWCWERVETLLQALGHKTVAVDLPAHGKAGGDIAAQNLDTYVDCVVAELDRHSEPVILAGHSMAGVIISMAAEKRPEKVKKLVYIAAFLLAPGQSGHGIDGTGVKPKNLLSASPDGVTVGCSDEMLRTRYGNHCSAVDQNYICDNLCAEVVQPLITPIYPTEERWGSIRRFYIAGTDDLAFDPETVRKMLTRLPCEEAYEIVGDHELFASATVELSFVLNHIALKA